MSSQPSSHRKFYTSESRTNSSSKFQQPRWLLETKKKKKKTRQGRLFVYAQFFSRDLLILVIFIYLGSFVVFLTMLMVWGWSIFVVSEGWVILNWLLFLETFAHF